MTKLQKYQPKVIALDLYRDLPQPPGNQELLTQLKAPNVVGINKLSDSDSPGVPAPPGIPPDRVGFNDLVLDGDGVVRRHLLSVSQAQKNTAYSFSVQVALLYLKDRVQPENSPVHPHQINWGKAEFVPLTNDSGGYANLDARGYQIMLKYRSANQVARQVSIRQVLNGEIDPNWVKDKIVLIGTTAPSTRDLFLTPYSPAQQQSPKMPGVLVHAQMLSQILSAVVDGRSLFWVWPEWAEILWNGCLGGDWRDCGLADSAPCEGGIGWGCGVDGFVGD